MSFPALDETAECNTFVFSFSFNVLMLIEKKLSNICHINPNISVLSLMRFKHSQSMQAF